MREKGDTVRKFKIENGFKLFIALYFLLYFCIGIYIFPDYGVSADEEIQRQHSLVSYRYLNKEIFNREIAALSGTPELDSYVIDLQ